MLTASEQKAIAKIDMEKIITLIYEVSIVAWDGRLTREMINSWLKNFNGEALKDEIIEKKLAAWLLLNFTFFTERDIEAMCQDLYRTYLHSMLQLPEFPKDISRRELVKKIHNDTVFLPLGNPSESGGHILYYFRNANKLSKELFSLERQEQCKNIVWIDDVSISGTQLQRYINGYLRKSSKEKRCHSLIMLATEDAIEAVRNLPIFSHYCLKLDDRTKCFSDESYVFSGKVEHNFSRLSKIMCEHYGKKIVADSPIEYMRSYPLGFKDSQQMIGFCYNTPNNTMPIFWHDRPFWRSIFKRNEKFYGKEGEIIDDEQFI